MFLARFCILNFSFLGLSRSGFGFFVVGLSVSEADSLVESQLCDIVFQMSVLVLLGCILRRCLFQVVSVTGALKLRLI